MLLKGVTFRSRAVVAAVVLTLLVVVSSCHTAQKGVSNAGNGGIRSEAGRQFPAETSRGKLYDEATKWIGTPYAYGGHSKDGADCSGFVMEVYKAVYGVQLHRNSAEIFQKDCVEIPRDEMGEGDLVFFTNDFGSRINHVGIYLSDDKFIHSSSSKGVVISDMKQNYYVKRFYKAGRVAVGK